MVFNLQLSEPKQKINIHDKIIIPISHSSPKKLIPEKNDLIKFEIDQMLLAVKVFY
jgi:hypothetical protein